MFRRSMLPTSSSKRLTETLVSYDHTTRLNNPENQDFYLLNECSVRSYLIIHHIWKRHTQMPGFYTNKIIYKHTCAYVAF
jgi:hypothetical protein